MNYQELRIGNYYQFASNTGVVYRSVSSIMKNEFGFYSDADGTNFEICKPIPISEQYLLGFGFLFKDTNEFRHFYVLNDFVLDENYQPVDYDLKYELKYLHQLQNLYLDLTGEELKFKS